MRAKRNNGSAKVFALLVIATLSGCATVVSGGRQNVRFSSTPSGAEVRIYDEYESEVWSGLTPVSASLQRGSGFFSGASYRVEILLEGYEPATVFIRPHLNGFWYLAGNFFLGGPIGWLIVDPATGAMWNLSPEVVNARLSEITAVGGGGELAVVLRRNLPDELAADLDLIGTLVPKPN